jgi:hypothetical protein
MLDAHVNVVEPNDDWVDPVDYWWATGEGWEDIPPEQQNAILARIGPADADMPSSRESADRDAGGVE